MPWAQCGRARKEYATGANHMASAATPAPKPTSQDVRCVCPTAPGSTPASCGGADAGSSLSWRSSQLSLIEKFYGTRHAGSNLSFWMQEMENIRNHVYHFRAPLIYGQPHGGVPCGRFSDRLFFFILVSFLSFSDFKKFFQEKKFEKKIKMENQRKKLECKKFFEKKRKQGTFKRKKFCSGKILQKFFATK